MSAAVLVMETHLRVNDVLGKVHLETEMYYVHVGLRRDVLGEVSQEKSIPA